MEKSTKILIADENSAQRQSLIGDLRRAGYVNMKPLLTERMLLPK